LSPSKPLKENLKSTLSEEELISKFKANSEKKMFPSRMEDIIKATQKLEDIDEIGEYMELLVSDKK
jgi:2-methylcitrate dehydratase